MITRLDLFKKRMEPAEKLYTSEISNFTKKYDELGEMVLVEEPDIDTQDYIYRFEKANGTPQEVLDNIVLEISNHMDEFSKDKGIEKFCQHVVIWV